MPIIDRTVTRETGLVTEIGFEDDKLCVRYTQDASDLHAQNQRMREDDGYWREGVKKGLMHGVSMSDADCLKMMVEDGISPYDCTVEELHRHIWRHRDKWGHVIVTKARIGLQGR